MAIADCKFCSAQVSMTTWEKWNGFLVACKNCGRWTGEYWYTRSIMSISLVLNVLSFFFLLPPKKALLVATPFLALIGAAFVWDPTRYPTALEVAWFSVVLFGPGVINAVLLIKHRINLGQAAFAAAATQGTPNTASSAASTDQVSSQPMHPK